METKDFLSQSWVKQEIIARIDYDPETGILTWSDRDCPYFDKSRVGKQVGYSWTSKGYTNNTVRMEIRGRKVTLVVARLCWLVHTGDWPEYTVDHIDRNTLNNKWDNLRDVPQSVNNQNKGPYKKRVCK